MKNVWLIIVDNHNSEPDYFVCSTEEAAESTSEEIIENRYHENEKEISEALKDGFYESEYGDNVVILKQTLIDRNLKIKENVMKKEDEKQLIYLINKLRNEYCKRYNCCFNKDRGYHYEKENLCPLCYDGCSSCMCDDILSLAFKTKLTDKRPHRL